MQYAPDALALHNIIMWDTDFHAKVNFSPVSSWVVSQNMSAIGTSAMVVSFSAALADRFNSFGLLKCFFGS